MDAEAYVRDVLKTGRWCPHCDTTRIDDADKCPVCNHTLWTRQQLWEELTRLDEALELTRLDEALEDQGELPLAVRHEDSDLAVQLPPCPKCGSGTEFKVCSNIVSCIKESCGWRVSLKIHGYPRPASDRSVVHKLKTWPVAFDAVRTGAKPMDIRKDDRSPPFEAGDRLHLCEWSQHDSSDSELGSFTGEELLVDVQAVFREEAGVPEGYALMTIALADGLPNNDAST